MIQEMEVLKTELEGRVSTNDWDALLYYMREILASEGEAADFISRQFDELSERVNTAPIQDIRNHVAAFRKVLNDERKALIQQEASLYSII